MRLLISRAVSGFIFLTFLTPSLVFADRDPVAGSPAAKEGLTNSYRETVRTLLKFDATQEGKYPKSDKYWIHRQVALSSIIRGLDNIDSFSVNRLIVDMSAVNLGESIAPLYSCLVQRKAKQVRIFLKENNQYSLTDWCTRNFSERYCFSKEDAYFFLKYDIAQEGEPECGFPLY